MDDNNPLESLNGLSGMATYLHELFLTLVNAGFSEEQALKLVMSTITASVQRGGTDA